MTKKALKPGKYWKHSMKNKFPKLARLSQIEVRDFWKDEARDFTPWLCEEKNLQLLSNTIGIDLELVGKEQSVGGYKLDILAKESDTDQYVIIENQLEKTNHKHLGQLLTYASGFNAKAVIWIAPKISEAHRKAMDWLNEMTSDEVGFFAIEIELWRIGDSAPAPKFSLISQPNDWAKSFSSVTKGGRRVLTEINHAQKEFWTNMIDHFKKNNTFVSLQKPHPRHWFVITVGRTHFQLSLTLHSRLKKVGCELYIRPPESKLAFSQLKLEKKEIEAELNAKLEWKELPNRGASRIVQYLEADYQNRKTWPKLFRWFQERTESFHNTFSQRVIDLDIDDMDEEAA